METQNPPPDHSHNHRGNLDLYWMGLALGEAESAARRGEVPVGAVLIDASGVIGTGGNSPISQCDPTAHAEILALRAAATLRHNYRLPDATLYVTLEPCLMCMGALLHARVKRLVYGATDPKGGAAHTLYTVGDDPRLNHRITVVGGVLAEESTLLLKDFFRRRRENARSGPAAF